MEKKHEDTKYVCKDRDDNHPESVKVNNGFCVPTLDWDGDSKNDCITSCNIENEDMLPDVIRDNTINGISDVFSYVFYGKIVTPHIYHIKYPMFTEDLTNFIDFCNNTEQVLFAFVTKRFSRGIYTFLDVLKESFSKVTGLTLPYEYYNSMNDKIINIYTSESMNLDKDYWGYNNFDNIYDKYIHNWHRYDPAYVPYLRNRQLFVEYSGRVNLDKDKQIRKYIYLYTPGHVIACVYEPKTNQIIVFETDSYKPLNDLEMYTKLFNEVFNLDVNVIMFDFKKMQGNTPLCTIYTLSILTLAILNPSADIYLLISMFAKNENAKHKLLALNAYNIWLYRHPIRDSEKLTPLSLDEATMFRIIPFRHSAECLLNVASGFRQYTKNHFRVKKK